MRGKRFFTQRTVGNMITVAFGVLLFLALSNFAAIRAQLGWFFNIISPFVIGIGMAYLLNIPLRFLERTVFKRLKRKRGLALATTYIAFLVILAVLLGMVLPQVAQSIMLLVGNVEGYIGQVNNLTDWLTQTLGLDPETLAIVNLSYTDLVNWIGSWFASALPELVNATVKIGSSVVSLLTAFIASLYMLAAKDKLLAQTRKVFYAALPKRRADELYRIGGLSDKLFSGFITGKVLDSAIIGLLTYVFMGIMNLVSVYFGLPNLYMPFAPLISVVIGITNIIPFFGPVIGAIPSILIRLLDNPWSALWFGIFIIVLQQFDGNILGPKILGESTGLPPLWVLIAIIVGGGLFGFLGMLLGVPAVAVLYTLASELVSKRRTAKGLDERGKPLENAGSPEGPPEEAAT